MIRTINRKMMMGFGVIIILMISANAYILYQLVTISNTAKITLTSEVKSIEITKHLQSLLYEEERNAYKYWISYNKIYFDLFLGGSKKFNESVDSLLITVSDPGGKQLISNVQRTHAWFFSQLTPFVQRKQLSKIKISKLEEQKRADSLNAIHTNLNDLIQLNQVSIDNAMINVETITTRSSGVSLILTLCTLIAAITLAVIISRTITKPIKVLIQGTEHIARGSFEPIKVASHDEIAQLAGAVNDMSEKLKRINEHKSELMHNIAHELRNPFQIILAALYRLSQQKTGPLNEQQIELLGSIRKSITASTNFTNQLLDIAKIDSGMMEYNLKPIDLLSLVKPIVDNARLIASQKEITIILNSEPVPIIVIDEEKISAIVSNLLSNAIKYTGRGGKITTYVSRVGNHAKISVEDSGIGIAQEELAKVFNKFYQVKNASQTSSKGTGIGLALVKAYTEGHGGKVSVNSVIGIGTTFQVDIPIILEHPQIDIAEESISTQRISHENL
jgi:two-component system, NtrC family, sensor histidine kinase GlrK